jgi:hypothetical protein
MREPPGLTNPLLNSFIRNEAFYGRNWATEGDLLMPASMEINHTETLIPFVLVSLLDAYQQAVNTDSSTTIEVLIRTSPPWSCYDLPTYLITSQDITVNFRVSSGML